MKASTIIYLHPIVTKFVTEKVHIKVHTFICGLVLQDVLDASLEELAERISTKTVSTEELSPGLYKIRLLDLPKDRAQEIVRTLNTNLKQGHDRWILTD